MDRLVVAAFVICAGLLYILQDAPRLLFEWRHADEYVNAPGLEMVEGSCSNWAPIPFDHCSITYRSRDGQRSGELDDWKFGPEMADTAHLMQWRKDRNVVSSDISLNAIVNRLAFAGAVIAFGVTVLAVSLVRWLRGHRYEAEYQPEGDYPREAD